MVIHVRLFPARWCHMRGRHPRSGSAPARGSGILPGCATPHPSAGAGRSMFSHRLRCPRTKLCWRAQHPHAVKPRARHYFASGGGSPIRPLPRAYLAKLQQQNDRQRGTFASTGDAVGGSLHRGGTSDGDRAREDVVGGGAGKSGAFQGRRKRGGVRNHSLRRSMRARTAAASAESVQWSPVLSARR